MTPLPTGPGQLVLGTSGQGFAISRLGSKAKPIEVPGLAADRASGSLVVANPAGGWVVVYATAPAGAGGQQPTRLATVSIAGVVRPFGESLGRQSAPTGLAVRPDGSAVAVAVPSPTGTSRIDLVPLPGHAGAARSWIMPRGPGATTLGVEQVAVSLSFEPNGAALTYLPAAETGGGLTNDGAVTLDITAPGRIAPITSGWLTARSPARAHWLLVRGTATPMSPSSSATPTTCCARSPSRAAPPLGRPSGSRCRGAAMTQRCTRRCPRGSSRRARS